MKERECQPKTTLNREEAAELIMELMKELADESESDTSDVSEGAEAKELTMATFLEKREKMVAFWVKKFVEDVLRYCNRRDFPIGLVYTAVELIEKRLENALSAAESGGAIPNAPVSEVKMDDVTFKFAVSAVDLSAVFGDELFKGIVGQLNLYRKVKSR